MENKKVIYFLCTGNSCRSQIAEGFAHKYLSDQFEVHSAGIEAHGVNPKAVEVMKEVGVDISNQKSKVIDLEDLNKADYVITLCGDAEERCPMTPPHVKREHWGFEDPAKAEGTEKQKQEVFRRVRDGIEKKIKAFAKEGNHNRRLI
jgi:arsenate reductase